MAEEGADRTRPHPDVRLSYLLQSTVGFSGARSLESQQESTDTGPYEVCAQLGTDLLSSGLDQLDLAGSGDLILPSNVHWNLSRGGLLYLPSLRCRADGKRPGLSAAAD